jgi:hypothetical protein
MLDISSVLVRRGLFNTIAFVILWILNIALMLLGGPVWAIVLASLVGMYFALRDWRVVRGLAKAHISPPHPDAAVQDLIDGKIEISEYRRRKETPS